GVARPEGQGPFRCAPFPDGRSRAIALLAGLEGAEASTAVPAGTTSDVPIDMPIAPISQTVEVVGSASVAPTGSTIAASDAIGGRELEQFTGGGFTAALRLLASIIEVPGGLSIKGGRPSQASVQIGPGPLVAPPT